LQASADRLETLHRRPIERPLGGPRFGGDELDRLGARRDRSVEVADELGQTDGVREGLQHFGRLQRPSSSVGQALVVHATSPGQISPPNVRALGCLPQVRQDPTVGASELAEGLLAHRLQQTRRTFDVREQQRDRARRNLRFAHPLPPAASFAETQRGDQAPR
jgi:hypothetical protein